MYSKGFEADLNGSCILLKSFEIPLICLNRGHSLLNKKGDFVIVVAAMAFVKD